MNNSKLSIENQLIDAVKQFQNGDKDAFKTIYDNSVRYVNYSILMSLQDKDLAEDILQETYLEVYKNLNSLNNPESFKKWAVVIAHNKISRYYMKNKDSVFFTDEEMDSIHGNDEEYNADMLPEDAMDNQETQRLILDIIGGLPDIQRETIISFYYNQMSVSEISDALGVPESTTKTNLFRGRKKIKDGILELEKKHGTKLYTLPLVAVLSSLFAKEAMAAEIPVNGLVLLENEAAASAATESVSGAVIKGAAITSVKFTGTKWILAVAASMIIVGVGVGAVYTLNNQKNQEAAFIEETVNAEDEDDFLGSEEKVPQITTIKMEETHASIPEEVLEEDSSKEFKETDEESKEEPEQEIDYNEEYYRDMMKDITSEPIAAICVDDFDGDGIKGAFVVTFVDNEAIEWMQEDTDWEYNTSSLYYLEKEDYNEIYKDDPQYSSDIGQLKPESGENIFRVGTNNGWAASRNHDDTLYIVRNHEPICLGTTNGSAYYSSDGVLLGSIWKPYYDVEKDETTGEIYEITPYTIKDDKLVAGDMYEEFEEY